MIRTLDEQDLPAVGTVIEANGLFPRDLLAEMTAPFLAGGESPEFWLVDDEGGPTGVAYCAPERMTSGTWNLYLIAIHPEHQGRGRGSALIREVEATLRRMGERLLLVETSGLDAFARTRSFYRRNGYDEEARIRDFYRAGEDKVVFRKAL